MGDPTEKGIIIPHADTRATRNPTVRAAMERFLSGLTEEIIEKSLSRLLDQPLSQGNDYDTIRSNTLGVFINPEAVGKIPAAVNPYLLGEELLQLNHIDLWFDLLSRRSREDPELAIGLAAAFPLIDPNGLLLHTSKYISEANQYLPGGVLTCYAVAAIYGETYYPSVISYAAKYSAGNPSGSIDNQRYLAGLEASRMFDGPAQNPLEVISRLQQLFPATAQDSKIMPAVSLVHKTKSLTNVYPDDASLPPAITCAAKDATGLLFSAYGKILARPTYQQRLIGAISPKR